MKQIKSITKTNVFVIFVAIMMAASCIVCQGNSLHLDNIFYLVYFVLWTAMLTFLSDDQKMLAGISGLLSGLAFLIQLLVEHATTVNHLVLWPVNVLILTIGFILLITNRHHDFRSLTPLKLSLVLFGFIGVSIIGALVFSHLPMHLWFKFFTNNFGFNAYTARLQLFVAVFTIVSSILVVILIGLRFKEMWIFWLISSLGQLCEVSTLLFVPSAKLMLNSVNVWFPLLYIVICLLAVRREVLGGEQ